jgi:hypothetical protein
MFWASSVQTSSHQRTINFWFIQYPWLIEWNRVYHGYHVSMVTVKLRVRETVWPLFLLSHPVCHRAWFVCGVTTLGAVEWYRRLRGSLELILWHHNPGFQVYYCHNVVWQTQCHSFCGLTYDRSVASSKTSSPPSPITCFLFQFPVYIFRVIIIVIIIIIATITVE